jgi:hypothetical protein
MTLKFLRYLIILNLAAFLANHANAEEPPQQFDLSINGTINSDQYTKEQEALINFKYDTQKLSGFAKFNFEAQHQPIDNVFYKTKELYDYEQQFNYKVKGNNYLGAYLRHKDNHFATSAGQNYDTLLFGFGSKIKFINFDLFVGQRSTVINNIYIYRPAINFEYDYNKFLFNNRTSMLRGSAFKVFQTKSELSYKLSKRIYLNFTSIYESTKDRTSTNFERSSTIGFKFRFGRK